MPIPWSWRLGVRNLVMNFYFFPANYFNLMYHVDHDVEAGTITFILISDHIVDHCSKIDLRSYQDHMAVK
jgi:hypothetical protein